MSAIGVATRGIIKPCCGNGPIPPQPEHDYTGFIRKEEIPRPVIKVEKFYSDDEGKHTRENDGIIKVTSAKFVIKEDEE